MVYMYTTVTSNHAVALLRYTARIYASNIARNVVRGRGRLHPLNRKYRRLRNCIVGLLRDAKASYFE